MICPNTVSLQLLLRCISLLGMVQDTIPNALQEQCLPHSPEDLQVKVLQVPVTSPLSIFLTSFQGGTLPPQDLPHQPHHWHLCCNLQG